VGEIGAAARLTGDLLFCRSQCQFLFWVSFSFFSPSPAVILLYLSQVLSLSIQKKSSLCTPLANKLLISYFILRQGPFGNFKFSITLLQIRKKKVLLYYTFDTSPLEELRAEMIRDHLNKKRR
jgi:hypothetical protein